MRKLRNNYIRLIIFVVACIAVAVSVLNFNMKFSKTLGYAEKTSEETELVLKVVSYPVCDDEKQKMICEIIKCDPVELEGEKTRLLLDITNGKPVSHGDVLALRGVLSPADGGSVPGAFDYRNYLKSLDVASQCIAKYEDVTLVETGSGFSHFVYSIRNGFMQSVENAIPPEYAGLVTAVITGDRSGINEEVSESLKAAGVYHIVAISGLHLNIFVSLIALMLSKIRAGRLKKLLITYGTCLVCGAFVVIFTGYGVSVIRAFSMLAILFVSTVFSRDYNAKNSLVVSAFVILIFMPCNIYSTAFYLSFLSTLGVLISADITKYLEERGIINNTVVKALIQVMVTSAATTLLTLPVTSVSFGYIPLYSWLANLIILPVMAPFLVSVLIFALASGFGALYVAIPASYAASAFSFAIMSIAEFIAHIPFAAPTVYLRDVIVVALIILMVVAAICVARKCGVKYAICLPLVFTLAFAVVLKYNAIRGTAKVHFVDVGQGDCAIAEMPDGSAIMIDCGTQGESDYLNDTVNSFLRNRNIKVISAAFVSHYHSDHANGTYELLNSGVIKNLFLPLYADLKEDEAKAIKSGLLANASKGDVNVRFVSKGTSVQIGEALIEVLLPDSDMYFKNNEMSAVIKLTYGENVFLFTGDAEHNAIGNLKNSEIDCDVLKVPHHGSKNGMTDTFCSVTSPEYAVISCGRNNIYDHPSQEVIEILEDNKTPYFRTDIDGTITYTVNTKEILNIKTTG